MCAMYEWACLQNKQHERSWQDCFIFPELSCISNLVSKRNRVTAKQETTPVAVCGLTLMMSWLHCSTVLRVSKSLSRSRPAFLRASISFSVLFSFSVISDLRASSAAWRSENETISLSTENKQNFELNKKCPSQDFHPFRDTRAQFADYQQKCACWGWQPPCFSERVTCVIISRASFAIMSTISTRMTDSAALTLLSEIISLKFSVSLLASSVPAPSSTHSLLIRLVHSWKTGNICLWTHSWTFYLHFLDVKWLKSFLNEDYSELLKQNTTESYNTQRQWLDMDASEKQVHGHAQICLKPQLSVFKCKEGRGVDQQKMKYNAENVRFMLVLLLLQDMVLLL